MANLLTTSRLFLAAAFAVVVAAGGADMRPGEFWGLVVLALAAETTDLLDGPLARSEGTAGVAGGIFDPLADSLGRLAIYFPMALAGWITIAVPLVMVGRDIVVAYTRIVQALAGGKTSARLSGKLKAILQGAGIFPILVLAALPDRAMGLDNIELARGIIAGVLIAATAWSMIDYVRAAWPAISAMKRK